MEQIDERLLRWSETLHFKFLDTMTDEELSWQEVPCCQNKDEEKFVQDTLIKHGAIPIDKLEVGKTYIGFCRNASEAVWQGDKFVYQRYKWGTTYQEEINHFQNDDGYDVFVPVRLKAISNKFDKAIADSITETGKQLMENLLTEMKK